MSGARLRIDVVTLFPDMFRGALDHSILARAAAAGLVSIRLHDLRQFSLDPHRKVDDAPFGGGGGMVLQPEPLFRAIEAITERPAGVHVADEAVVLLSAAGPRHDQATVRRLAGLSRIVLVCGRYEGVDERVASACTETLSVGDFVLSGGEPAALVVVDSVVRVLPGAIGNPEGAATESYEDGLLEAPHYTRPASFRGLEVPPVLLSGNHAEVQRWRRRESLRRTELLRPDMLRRAAERGGLDDEAMGMLSARDGAGDEAGDGEAGHGDDVGSEGRDSGGRKTVVNKREAGVTAARKV